MDHGPGGGAVDAHKERMPDGVRAYRRRDLREASDLTRVGWPGDCMSARIGCLTSTTVTLIVPRSICCENMSKLWVAGVVSRLNSA